MQETTRRGGLELCMFLLAIIVGFILAIDFASAIECNPGDINGDGTVNLQDLTTLARSFNSQDYCGYEDINEDGKVGLPDLVTLSRNWGQSTGICEQRVFSCMIPLQTTIEVVENFDNLNSENIEGFGVFNENWGGGVEVDSSGVVFENPCNEELRGAKVIFNTENSGTFLPEKLNIKYLARDFDNYEGFDVYVNGVFVKTIEDIHDTDKEVSPASPQYWKFEEIDLSSFSIAPSETTEISFLATGQIGGLCQITGQVVLAQVTVTGRQGDIKLSESTPELSYKTKTGEIVILKPTDPITLGKEYNIKSSFLITGFRQGLEKGKHVFDVSIKVADKVIKTQAYDISESPTIKVLNVPIVFRQEEVKDGKIKIEATADERNKIEEIEENNNKVDVQYSALQSHAPEIKKIEIRKNWLKDASIEKDWIKYTDVFEKDLSCVLVLNDVYDKKFYVDYKIKVNAIEKKSGTITCTLGAECPIAIPYSIFESGANITCEITAKDDFDFSNSGKAEITLPFIDLFVEKIDVFDVVSGTDLIAGKKPTARVWVSFTSNLIREIDKDIPVTLTQDKAGTKKTYTTNVNGINYYIMTWLKQNPLTKLGTTQDKKDIYSYQLLEKIKAAKDTSNFVNLDALTSGDYKFTAEITDSAIKEKDKTNNKLPDAGIVSKKVLDFSGDYKLGFVVFKNANTLTEEEKNAAKEFVEKSPKATSDISPFLLSRIKTTFNETEIIVVDYNVTKLGGANTEALTYASQVRTDILTKLEKWKKDNGVDFATALVVEKNILLSNFGNEIKPAAGISGTNSNLAIIMPYVKSDIGFGIIEIQTIPEILIHEMGHGLVGINDEYSATVKGKAIAENGWIESEKTQVINIWTEIPTGSTGQKELSDLPEHSPELSQNPNLVFGKRYFNVMGGGSAIRSMNKETYTKYLNKLKELGFIR